MARTEAISGSVLMVAAAGQVDALLDAATVEQASLAFVRCADPDAAIARLEAGERADVVLLPPGIDDPVRVAQRLHSLDRLGAVVVLAEPGTRSELRRALQVAPFLDGDVTMLVAGDAQTVVAHLAAAAGRTRSRRDAAGDQVSTPPPLSASYLGTLLDSVPLGLVTLDASGAVIGWNKRTGEMLAVPEVDALGRPFADLFEPADAPRLAALIGRLGSSGIEEGGEIFHRGVHAYELTGARFAIRSGEGGTLLILQDVTARERAEQELRLQKTLSDAQADTSGAGIVILSLSGELERANRRFVEMWGLTEEEMRRERSASRQKMLDQVEDPEQFLDAVGKLAATGEGDYRDELRLKDGRVIERYAAYAHTDGGEPLGQIWFFTDITERKHDEDALRFLADATNLLSSSLDYQLTLQRVADLAVPRIADRCSVEVVDGRGSREAIALADCDPERLTFARVYFERHPDVDSGALTTGMRSSAAQLVNGLSRDQFPSLARTEDRLRLLEVLDPTSVMVVPIRVRDRVFGTINFIRSGGVAYDAADLQLAEELARRAAIAIDNSRVHAELRSTARTLQESLLPPHLPAIRGLELAARFRPAGVGMQVGGDFYDIFETGPGQWGIAVGDVCGKGAAAAALTALTRYTVRAAAMYETDAAGVLRVLNEALLRQRGDFRFTTLVFCLVNLGERPSVRIATGGHPQPLLLSADGSAAQVGVGGPLLGVVAGAEFHDAAVELHAGDTLVLYTDGLTDALAPQRMLDERDLLATLADCRGASAEEISLRLEDEALDGDPTRVPRDDIALVVAKLL